MIQFLGIILLLVSTGSIAYGIREVLLAEESRNWPKVTGIIIRSEIEKYVKNESDVYRVNLCYSYNANGKIYENSKICFMHFSSGFQFMADKLLKKYQLNTPVKVYCQPSNPQNSVLEPGFNAGFVIFFSLCSIFMITGIYFLTK